MGLKDLDSLYDNTQQAERKGGRPPDGSYQTRIDKVSMEDTDNGNPMLKLDTIIQAGEYAGSHIFINRVITANTLAHTKADLAVLGWAHKLSDLEDQTKLASLLDKWIEVRQVTKGKTIINGKEYDNTNVYINRAITPNAAPPQTNRPASARTAGPVNPPGAAPAGSPIVSREVVHKTPPKAGELPTEPPF